MFFLLFLLQLLASAAITNVRIESSPTQAVIKYDAPDATTACSLKAWDMNLPVYISAATGNGTTVTVDTRGLVHGLAVGQSIYIEGTGVAQWEGEQTVASTPSQIQFTFSNATSGSASTGMVGLLVHDINTTLFSGSNSDGRTGNLTSGRLRTFVLGNKTTGVVGNEIYSRALQTNSLHRYLITCGGDTAAGTFHTSNIPLGLMNVDVPRPSSPGSLMWPTVSKAGRWESSNGAFLSRVIDPVTGVLYTPIYPPEIMTSTAFGLSTTNTPTPVGSNWTDPGNVRTNDSTSATYAAATQDPLCIRPYLVTLANTATRGQWTEQVVSLENIVATVRGSGAGSGADGDVEVAYSINGCVSAATDWKTVDLTGSLSSVSFPSGTPMGGFGDWHSGSQRRLNHIDVVTHRGTVDTSGTAATAKSTNGTHRSRFDPINWTNGSKIRIGGSVGDSCNAGTEYDIASVENPRALTLSSSAGTNSEAWWCAANFAVMIRKKTTSTDQVNIDYVDLSLRTAHLPGYHNSGSAKVFGENTLADSDGNEGYLTYMSGSGGSTITMHWVSKDNGESRFIMGFTSLPAVAGADGWLQHNCGATENPFSATDPTKFYCVATGNSGGQVLIEYTIHWDGSGIWRSQTPSSTPIGVCTTTSPASPNPCLAARNVHEGYSLTELVQDRNSDYDPAKYATINLRGIQSHLGVLYARRQNQDSVAWLMIFDFDKPIASYDSMDQSTNPVVGAINTLHPSFRGMATEHTVFTTPGSNQYVQFQPKFGHRSNLATDNNGNGPWRMDVVSDAALNNTTDIGSCPDNQWGYTNCSTIHVTSHPFDPDPGAGETGAAGEYRNALVSDGLMIFKCNASDPQYVGETLQENGGAGCDRATVNDYPNMEFVRILSISGSAPDITLVVARGIVSTHTAKSHVSGYKLYQWPITDNNLQIGNTNMTWDYLTSPTGTPESGLAYFPFDTSHMSATSKLAVGAAGILPNYYGDVAWRSPTVDSLKQNPPVVMGLNGSTQIWPTQFGKLGIRFANTVQLYKANNQVNYPTARDTAYQFYIDSRPFMNTPQTPENALYEKVGGATYIYKYKRHQDIREYYPYFKHIPFYITSGFRTLMEKSGPSVTLADNSGDFWKFCLVWTPGECRSGSVFGEIYINLPYANLVHQADYACAGLNNWVWDEADICSMNLDPVLGPSIQFYFGNSDNLGRGRHVRKLGWGLQEAPKLHGQVPKVHPNGEWLGPLHTHFVNAHRNNSLMMKLPPIPSEDGYDRTTYVPLPVSVGSVPANTAFANVEFGYYDFGTPAQLYCTARQESCLATGTKIIGDGTVAAPYANNNPAASWATSGVTVAAGTPAVLTFPSAHKFSADVKLKSSIQTTNLNNKLWSINITGATTLELVGSVNGDVVTGSQFVMVPVIEAPFAFSGESFSVAGATNPGTIEISTTTMHRVQTGSNVCIAGVAGNTAANGCWTVTATGPSTFTLDGSTGNGTWTSGGTVTPGGVSCASGCTVVIPAVSKRVTFYRWRYLSSGGALLSTGPTHTVVAP